MYLEHRFVGFGCGRVPEEVIYILYIGRLLNIFMDIDKIKIFVI